MAYVIQLLLISSLSLTKTGEKKSRSKVWVLESVMAPSQWGGPDLTTIVTSYNFFWMGRLSPLAQIPLKAS